MLGHTLLHTHPSITDPEEAQITKISQMEINRNSNFEITQNQKSHISLNGGFSSTAPRFLYPLEFPFPEERTGALSL